MAEFILFILTIEEHLCILKYKFLDDASIICTSIKLHN